ncbi:acyl transferase/acyl hydrolase/lysophospholipase, partial [Flagelloscypha sp. PMI_526]
AIDGGGLSCLSQALIVREMLTRLQYDSGAAHPLMVVDYFDMIGGSGFGGLLAIMAGILEMTADELVDELFALCIYVFSDTSTLSERTDRLKASVKGIIGKYLKGRGGEARSMLSEHNSCKVFVCASSSNNMSFPHIFRTYRVRANTTPNCAVWEAACATMATPGLFEPITIGTVFRESFVGAGSRWSNPVQFLTQEAAAVFSGHVACIVSVGSGHPHILSASTDLKNLFKGISTDCQLESDQVSARFKEVPGLYWRLEVEQGLQGLGQIEDVATFDRILSSTASYLQLSIVSKKIDALLKVLHQRPESVTTQAIMGRLH